MRKKQNDTPLTEVDAKRIRRNAYIKMAAMVGIVAAAMAFGSIAWFTMNREVEGSGVQMTSSDLPFEIATKGEAIRNYDIISTKEKEYETGTAVGEYYKADSLLMRFDPVDDPETKDVDEKDNPPDIEPGCSGELILYVVPKNNEAFDVNVSLNVVAYAEIDKKNGNNPVYKTDDQGNMILDNLGNPIPDTELVEITTASAFAAAATKAGNTTVANEAADYVKAADYLKGHILFFGNKNQAEHPAYYFSDPLYYTPSNNAPAQPDRTKVVTLEANQMDQMVQIPLYWMWTNTFGQIALPDNVSGKINDLPILSETDSTGKAAMTAYLKNNITKMFDKSSNKTSGYIDAVTTHVQTAADFDDTAFKELSDGYNQADYQIGTRIAYFMIEVSVSLKE